jgi:catechol 2,3-dioxygenase-like lactoylglutathione lyase family enzyme
MLEQIDHINIVVDDLKLMTAFYRDVLGMRITKEVTIGGEWVERTVGLRGVKAEVVYLDPSTGPRVELIRYVSPNGTRPSANGDSNTKGIRHVAFRVTNIDGLFVALRAAGVEFLSEVQEVPESQVTYTGGVRKRLVYFRDPEGNLLELCEYRS